ncbi:MAG: hypothetical protein K0S41_3844 [Anaerocolumna sp.]|nr:hypothetical protein [Anaerocolumna sp.]
MDYREYSCMVYIIKQGDTLYSISREYNIPIALILRANPYVDIYNLQVGDELCVPVLGPVTWQNLMSYEVEEGDTLESIMDKFGVTLEELLQYNYPSDIILHAGSTLQLPELDM